MAKSKEYVSLWEYFKRKVKFYFDSRIVNHTVVNNHGTYTRNSKSTSDGTTHSFVVNGIKLKPGTPAYEEAKREFDKGMSSFGKDMEEFGREMNDMAKDMRNMFK